MKAVVQRVLKAEVEVEGESVSVIGPGLLTLLGIESGDTVDELRKLINKICDLRIFTDSSGKMNLSLADTQGEHLIVSQFTLAANCSSGRRPSFITAEKPDRARALYDEALQLSRARVRTAAGIFQADMRVSLINDGPVTFILEEKPASGGGAR